MASHTWRPHGETAAQSAAARRNLAKARAVGARKPRTAKQIAAARANLAHACHCGPTSAKQLLADRRNLAKARAAALNKPRTAAQRQAARNNLVKARAAKKHHLPKGSHISPQAPAPIGNRTPLRTRSVQVGARTGAYCSCHAKG